MHPKVDFFLAKASKWQAAYEKMRMIALDCGLQEELKWGKPCYTYQHNNIILIHGFKEYCAYLFFKGALLKDTNDLLIQQTENVQAARQIRFTSLQQIIKLEPVLKNYIYEAIEAEKTGLQVQMKETSEYAVPEEFDKILEANADLKKAFKSLTPGRQRAYLLYFSRAKLSKTRTARVEKYIPKILEGKGLND